MESALLYKPLFCKDCKYCSDVKHDDPTQRCLHPSALVQNKPNYNLVSGEIVTKITTASKMRMMQCGYSAELFVQKKD